MSRGLSPESNGSANLGSLTQRWNKLFVNEVDANKITLPGGDAAYMNDLINSFADPAEVHNSIYRGAEIANDWATIQANIQAGDFSNYYIGDWKQITLTTNETVIMEIAGINCYKGWGDTAIPNHIDFISRDCLATLYQMNSTGTNNGKTASLSSPWQGSELFNKMKKDTGEIWTPLPSDLKDVIIRKRAFGENRYSAGGPVSADTGGHWMNFGELWIPAETEVFDHPSWSEIGFGTSGFLQYPIFRLNPSKIVKGAGNGGSSCSWYLVSAARGNSSDFCNTGTGIAGYNNATTFLNVPLCFRVA